MAELEVEILSPAKLLAKASARQVHVPGAQGRLGILPGHAALVAELGNGSLILDTSSGTQAFKVKGGYIDVAKNKVLVLADFAEKA